MLLVRKVLKPKKALFGQVQHWTLLISTDLTFSTSSARCFTIMHVLDVFDAVLPVHHTLNLGLSGHDRFISWSIDVAREMLAWVDEEESHCKTC